MDEKIEAVARALCTFDGRDPDMTTRLPGGRVGFQSPMADTAPDGPLLWTAYREEAQKFVVAIEALQPFLRHDGDR